MRHTHFLRIAGATVFALVLTVGVVAAADMPDAWVTTKTKVALMATDGVGTEDHNVDIVNGVVTLHGKVATEAEKGRADRVARGIDGARDAKNVLQIVPGAARAVVPGRTMRSRRASPMRSKPTGASAPAASRSRP